MKKISKAQVAVWIFAAMVLSYRWYREEQRAG